MTKLKTQGTFGEIELSKEEFIKRWHSWSIDFGSLCSTGEDWKKYTALLATTKELAGKSFDAALSYAGQTKLKCKEVK